MAIEGVKKDYLPRAVLVVQPYPAQLWEYSEGLGRIVTVFGTSLPTSVIEKMKQSGEWKLTPGEALLSNIHLALASQKVGSVSASGILDGCYAKLNMQIADYKHLWESVEAASSYGSTGTVDSAGILFEIHRNRVTRPQMATNTQLHYSVMSTDMFIYLLEAAATGVVSQVAYVKGRYDAGALLEDIRKLKREGIDTVTIWWFGDPGKDKYYFGFAGAGRPVVMLDTDMRNLFTDPEFVTINGILRASYDVVSDLIKYEKFVEHLRKAVEEAGGELPPGRRIIRERTSYAVTLSHLVAPVGVGNEVGKLGINRQGSSSLGLYRSSYIERKQLSKYLVSRIADAVKIPEFLFYRSYSSGVLHGIDSLSEDIARAIIQEGGLSLEGVEDGIETEVAEYPELSTAEIVRRFFAAVFLGSASSEATDSVKEDTVRFFRRMYTQSQKTESKALRYIYKTGAAVSVVMHLVGKLTKEGHLNKNEILQVYSALEWIREVARNPLTEMSESDENELEGLIKDEKTPEPAKSILSSIRRLIEQPEDLRYLSWLKEAKSVKDIVALIVTGASCPVIKVPMEIRKNFGSHMRYAEWIFDTIISNSTGVHVIDGLTGNLMKDAAIINTALLYYNFRRNTDPKLTPIVFAASSRVYDDRKVMLLKKLMYRTSYVETRAIEDKKTGTVLFIPDVGSTSIESGFFDRFRVYLENLKQPEGFESRKAFLKNTAEILKGMLEGFTGSGRRTELVGVNIHDIHGMHDIKLFSAESMKKLLEHIEKFETAIRENDLRSFNPIVKKLAQEVNNRNTPFETMNIIPDPKVFLPGGVPRTSLKKIEKDAVYRAYFDSAEDEPAVEEAVNEEESGMLRYGNIPLTLRIDELPEDLKQRLLSYPDVKRLYRDGEIDSVAVKTTLVTETVIDPVFNVPVKQAGYTPVVVGTRGIAGVAELDMSVEEYIQIAEEAAKRQKQQNEQPSETGEASHQEERIKPIAELFDRLAEHVARVAEEAGIDAETLALRAGRINGISEINKNSPVFSLRKAFDRIPEDDKDFKRALEYLQSIYGLPEPDRFMAARLELVLRQLQDLGTIGKVKVSRLKKLSREFGKRIGQALSEAVLKNDLEDVNEKVEEAAHALATELGSRNDSDEGLYRLLTEKLSEEVDSYIGLADEMKSSAKNLLYFISAFEVLKKANLSDEEKAVAVREVFVGAGWRPYQIEQALTSYIDEKTKGNSRQLIGWEMRSGKTLAGLGCLFFHAISGSKDSDRDVRSVFFARGANVDDVLSQMIRFLPIAAPISYVAAGETNYRTSRLFPFTAPDRVIDRVLPNIYQFAELKKVAKFKSNKEYDEYSAKFADDVMRYAREVKGKNIAEIVERFSHLPEIVWPAMTLPLRGDLRYALAKYCAVMMDRGLFEPDFAVWKTIWQRAHDQLVDLRKQTEKYNPEWKLGIASKNTLQKFAGSLPMDMARQSFYGVGIVPDVEIRDSMVAELSNMGNILTVSGAPVGELIIPAYVIGLVEEYMHAGAYLATEVLKRLEAKVQKFIQDFPEYAEKWKSMDIDWGDKDWEGKVFPNVILPLVYVARKMGATVTAGDNLGSLLYKFTTAFHKLLSDDEQETDNRQTGDIDEREIEFLKKEVFGDIALLGVIYAEDKSAATDEVITKLQQMFEKAHSDASPVDDSEVREVLKQLEKALESYSSSFITTLMRPTKLEKRWYSEGRLESLRKLLKAAGYNADEIVETARRIGVLAEFGEQKLLASEVNNQLNQESAAVLEKAGFVLYYPSGGTGAYVARIEAPKDTWLDDFVLEAARGNLNPDLLDAKYRDYMKNTGLVPGTIGEGRYPVKINDVILAIVNTTNAGKRVNAERPNLSVIENINSPHIVKETRKSNIYEAYGTLGLKSLSLHARPIKISIPTDNLPLKIGFFSGAEDIVAPARVARKGSQVIVMPEVMVGNLYRKDDGRKVTEGSQLNIVLGQREQSIIVDPRWDVVAASDPQPEILTNRAAPYQIVVDEEEEKTVTGIVIDEVDEVRNPGSHGYRVLHALSRQAEVSIGMTGTPANGYPESAVALFSIIAGVSPEVTRKTVASAGRHFGVYTWSYMAGSGGKMKHNTAVSSLLVDLAFRDPEGFSKFLDRFKRLYQLRQSGRVYAFSPSEVNMNKVISKVGQLVESYSKESEVAREIYENVFLNGDYTEKTSFTEEFARQVKSVLMEIGDAVGDPKKFMEGTISTPSDLVQNRVLKALLKEAGRAPGTYDPIGLARLIKRLAPDTRVSFKTREDLKGIDEKRYLVDTFNPKVEGYEFVEANYNIAPESRGYRWLKENKLMVPQIRSVRNKLMDLGDAIFEAVASSTKLQQELSKITGVPSAEVKQAFKSATVQTSRVLRIYRDILDYGFEHAVKGKTDPVYKLATAIVKTADALVLNARNEYLGFANLIKKHLPESVTNIRMPSQVSEFYFGKEIGEGTEMSLLNGRFAKNILLFSWKEEAPEIARKAEELGVELPDVRADLVLGHAYTHRVLEAVGNAGYDAAISECLNNGKNLLVVSPYRLIHDVVASRLMAMCCSNSCSTGRENYLLIRAYDSESARKMKYMAGVVSAIASQMEGDLVIRVAATHSEFSRYLEEARLYASKGSNVTVASTVNYIARGVDLSFCDRLVTYGVIPDAAEFSQVVARLFHVNKHEAEVTSYGSVKYIEGLSRAVTALYKKDEFTRLLVSGKLASLKSYSERESFLVDEQQVQTGQRERNGNGKTTTVSTDLISMPGETYEEERERTEEDRVDRVVGG